MLYRFNPGFIPTARRHCTFEELDAPQTFLSRRKQQGPYYQRINPAVINGLYERHARILPANREQNKNPAGALTLQHQNT
jgi:hypothetical protein